MRLSDGRLVALPTDVQRGPTRIHRRLATETSDLAHSLDLYNDLWRRWADDAGVIVSVAVSEATYERR